MPSSDRRYWSGSALTSRMCSSTLRPARDAFVLLRVVAERHLVAERRPSPRSASSSPTSVLQQRGLARAVEAEHEHPLAAADVEGDVLEHGLGAERLGEVDDLERDQARARRLGQPHAHLALGPCRGRRGWRSSFSTRWSSVLAVRARFSVWPRIESASALRRSISDSWRAASFVRRSASALRATRYCEYVPRYSTSSPSSMCSTRVIAWSSSSRSWLITSSAAAVRCAGTASATAWRRCRGGSSARRGAAGRCPRTGCA